jgi:hypothetical protein
MASIVRSQNPGESLTILTVVGEVTSGEVVGALEQFLKGGVTRDLLWDFRGAKLSAIHRDDIERIIAVAKAGAHLRPDGRTALVVGDLLSFGISRMYELLAELKDHPIRHHVFRDVEEALAWLRPAPADSA